MKILKGMHPITFKLKSIVAEAKQNNQPEDYIKASLKEYLQDYILSFIYNNPNYQNLIFYGGTCARKIYELNRLSEDLDFSNPNKIDLTNFDKELQDYFQKTLEFKNVTVKRQGKDLLNRHTVKLPILFDLGLSPYTNENLHIKVEVATSEIKEDNSIKTPYTKNSLSFIINHYPKGVLMAGKMAAALTRVYKKGNSDIFIKGRDYYDLVWYMQLKVTPNEHMLQKLTDLEINEVWIQLDNKVKKIKYNDLYQDLAPFLENKSYIKDWCLNFQDFYKRYRENY